MTKSNFKSILIFTDGACSGNPGSGGWGAIIATPDGQIKELGGSENQTTNNRMELTATIFALREIENLPGEVSLYTDSTYVIRGITQWIWGWMKNGWKNAQSENVLNRDLWETLYDITKKRKKSDKISWLYSRGHVGTPGNERCDKIAVDYSNHKWVDLYEGPLLKYSVAVYDLPENSDLPEIKPRQEKKVAYSYLSYLNGEVWRHLDWTSCSRRVTGKSGAKFKKAMSKEDEKKIILEWGLNSNINIRQAE